MYPYTLICTARYFCPTGFPLCTWVLAGCLFATAVTGCDGCGGCREAPTTEDVAPDLPPDTVGIDMEAARSEADDSAVSLAVGVVDNARFLAGEIEGATTETEVPTVQSGPSGEIDSEALREVFNEHRSELQQCYERALKQSPDLAGRVIVEVDIGIDGRASRVVCRGDTLQSDTVNTCIEQRVRDWEFPKPTGGTARVRKPFSFSPKQ